MSTHESEPRLLGEDQIYGMLDQGRLLVGNSTNDMAIWDPAKGTVVRLPIYGGFETTNTGKSAWKVLVALKPDNSIIAVGRRDGTIELWSPSSQSKVRAWQAHRNAIYALAYSPDGRTLVTGSERGEIQLWDSTTQARLGHFEHQESGIQCFAISPNGKFLACGADVGFRVWNLATHTDAFRSDCDGSFVSDLGFSPDGKLLAISAMHLIEVHLWDPEAESRVAVLKGLRGYSFGTCFSPDGRTLASVGLEVKFWNVPTLLEVASLGEEGVSPWQVWFLPDGLGLALAHGKRNKHISLWRAPSLAEIDRIESRK